MQRGVPEGRDGCDRHSRMRAEQLVSIDVKGTLALNDKYFVTQGVSSMVNNCAIFM
jgi:hypothetical protein